MYFDAHSDIWSHVTTRKLLGETDILQTYHIDRLKKGGVEGGIFAIWVDPPFHADYEKRTREIMDCVRAEIAGCDEIRIVHTYDEMMKAKSDGKIYVLHGVEGMTAIGNTLSKIDDYYDFGCRHAMLTWNEVNALGAGASSGKTSGLTEVGKQAARKIQDKGMLLDVSHLNEAGFWDITKLSTKPIIASHSNCRALCDVPRNLTDDQLRAIRDLDGIVGLNSFGPFVDHEPDRQTIESFAKHASHMIDVMGIDHIGCGFDFFEFIDGETKRTMTDEDTPSVKGMKDCSEISKLFDCFENMGMTKDEMEKIASKNFLNVIKKAIG